MAAAAAAALTSLSSATLAPAPAPAPAPAAVDLDVEAVPEIASLLTVIITTSPTPSAPCTDLLSAVLASFRAHCPALLTCPVTVVFDTYDRVVPRARLKKGCVTAEEAKSYVAYKDNVRQLVRDVWAPVSGGSSSGSSGSTVMNGLAEYGSPFIADNSVAFTTTRMADGRIAFIEPAARLGFGLAVRTAVRAATTPYVWIQQHDWTLVSDIPLAAMLEVMRTCETRAAEQTSPRQTGHREATAGPDEGEQQEQTAESPGSGSQDTNSVASSCADSEEAEADAEAVPVRYICMPSVRMLRYATSPHVVNFPTLRCLTASMKSDFPVSASVSSASVVPFASNPAAPGHHDRLPLTPLFFWHDKTHLASTAHYLERVFSSRLAIGRGDFIEDHIGQRARTLMKNDPAVWRKWACWLYYPDDGNQLCLRHLQGRTWRGEDKEREMRDMYRERNRSAASAAAAAAMMAARSLLPSPPPSLMECASDILAMDSRRNDD